MAKKQFKNAKTASEEVVNYYDILLNDFSEAMLLATLQDVHGVEKLYTRAKLTHTNISKNCDENTICVSKLLLDFIKIFFHFSRGLNFALTNKSEKSFEEYKIANDTCNMVLEEFHKIENTMSKEFSSIFSVLRFLLKFFHLITSILKEDSLSKLQRKKGKYVNQVENLRNSAMRLREANNISVYLDGENEDIKDLIVNMLAFANRMADMYENNAEKIMEIDNKEITFLSPIDNKVFIVHGHDTAILLELKEILKNSYGIEPIILNEKPDKGKTVIEKFEHYAKFSSFVFVIITPDDFVKNKGKTYLQGRPNVLFELGWFCGRYGRDRVRILKLSVNTTLHMCQVVILLSLFQKMSVFFQEFQP